MKIQFRKTHMARLCIGLALLGSARASVAQTDAQVERMNAAPARRKFIEMLRISRLPTEEQKKSLAWVYRTLPQMPESNGVLSGGIASGAIFNAPPAGPAAAPQFAPDKTPEQIADGLLQGSYPSESLSIYGKALGREVLLARREDAIGLFNADFASGEEASVQRALIDLQQIDEANRLGQARDDPEVTKWLRQFEDSVLEVFQSEGLAPLASQAADVLGMLGDARAIDALVERDPERPTLFYQALGRLAHLAPPHPKVVEALGSPDAQVRFQAACALRAPDSLLPLFEPLLKDASRDVRRTAASHIFDMGDASVARARAGLVALLSDPDAWVRQTVLTEFVQRKDAVVAPALLKRLKVEATSPSRTYGRAALQIAEIVGHDFDTAPLDRDAKDEGFQKAVAEFEKWIAAHPAK